MALNKIDGANQARDNSLQRTKAGTIGGEMAIPASFGGERFSAIIDDTSTRIKYGSVQLGATVAFRVVGPSSGNTIVDGQTQTIIGGNDTTGTPFAAAQYRFKGTSIGVLGGINPYSGVLNVLIDGVPTAGRLPVFLPIDITSMSGPGTAAILASDTVINGFGQNSGFPAAGTMLIGNELITYTGMDLSGSGTIFLGVTRGALGTIAADHLANESIFVWGTTCDLATTADYATKQLLYYNPFLSPGEHSVTVYVTKGATYSRLYFDGFVTGSLVGAQNLFTQTATVTVSAGTDANGHAVLGGLSFPSTDITMIGMLGYTQVSAESSNTTPMIRLGVTRSTAYLNGETNLYFYGHNGPASTVISLAITFTYIGKTL